MFDPSKDHALIAGLDDTDDKDEDTSLAGVHKKDTSLAGVPIPNITIMINADNDFDTKSNHNSIDTNKTDNNSSKASIHSAGSYIPIHHTTSELPQHSLEELDDTELPELET